MHAFTGTGRLLRLAIRRDRVKLPIIILVLAGLFVSSVAATIDFYGKGQDALVQYAAATAPSVVSRVMAGPVGGPDIGAVVMNETFILILIANAFISTMAVVRHTRQNEELGRSELIESGVVARHASLAAAMLLVLFINLAVAGLMFVSLAAYDLPVAGSLAASAAAAAVGLTFGALAAVASQLADSARGANAYSALAIGTAFLLRAVGDGGGSLSPDGMAVVSAWPSWLSPFGWAQQIFPYTAQRFWIFWLFIALFIAAMTLAVAFMARRDIGMGMISTRPGRAAAKPALLSSFGLARRLQRGILRGWAVAIIVFSGAFGLTIREFENFLAENEEIQQAFSQFGTGTNYQDIFLAVLISMMAIFIAGYAVQALLRMRAEETGGQLENILAAAVGRRQWLLGHTACIFLGVLLLLVLMAASMGLVYIVSVGAAYSELWRIFGAALAQGSAILAFSGFVIAIFGLMPRLAVPLAWGALAGTLVIVQVGALLKLPQWIMNISPFVHLPAMPASGFKLAPVIWLSIIGLGLLSLGLLRFRRRDVIAG